MRNTNIKLALRHLPAPSYAISKTWKKPGEATKDFNTARAVANNRIIFKINRNDYRLIVEFNYVKGWAFIKFIGTRAE